MYQDAFAACYYDNPRTCTAFVSSNFYDTQLGKETEIYPYYFDENLSKKPAYDAIMYAIQNPCEFAPTNYGDCLMFSNKPKGTKNKLQCSDCFDSCRKSWPINDPLKGRSDQADFRCMPVYDYGETC